MAGLLAGFGLNAIGTQASRNAQVQNSNTNQADVRYGNWTGLNGAGAVQQSANIANSPGAASAKTGASILGNSSAPGGGGMGGGTSGGSTDSSGIGGMPGQAVTSPSSTGAAVPGSSWGGGAGGGMGMYQQTGTSPWAGLINKTGTNANGSVNYAPTGSGGS